LACELVPPERRGRKYGAQRVTKLLLKEKIIWPPDGWMKWEKRTLLFVGGVWFFTKPKKIGIREPHHSYFDYFYHSYLVHAFAFFWWILVSYSPPHPSHFTKVPNSKIYAQFQLTDNLSPIITHYHDHYCPCFHKQ